MKDPRQMRRIEWIENAWPQGKIQTLSTDDVVALQRFDGEKMGLTTSQR